MAADNPCGSAEIGQMLKIDKARHDAIARQWARKYADAREVTMEETQLCRARQRLAFAQLGEPFLEFHELNKIDSDATMALPEKSNKSSGGILRDASR